MTLNTCCCGKDSFMSKCSSDSFGRVSCGKLCDKLLSCSKHHCSQICHQGRCEPCPIQITKKCRCTKTERVFGCGEDYEFQCNEICGFKFDCNIHTCDLDCHDISHHSKLCPFDPTILATCPCGKTQQNRLKCSDKVLTCSKPCNRKLSCSHPCNTLCHNGEWYVKQLLI